jgi:hypothetical protein
MTALPHVCTNAPEGPNGRGEPRPEAEAKRRLLGVGSSAGLDAVPHRHGGRPGVRLLWAVSGASLTPLDK